MKKNLLVATVVLLCSCIEANSQTIDLEFPHLAGKTYDFKLVQGSKHVTISSDTIKKDGKMQFRIPKEYTGYKGMAMWYLTNSSTGGGLDLVVNNENFSVSCLDSVYTDATIVFKNTKENELLKASAKEQALLFEQYDAMTKATKAFSKEDSSYPLFMSELEKCEQKYQQYYARLKASPLFAAKFRLLDNMSRGIGSIITQDMALKAQDFNRIVVQELDYNDLYTSNHWYRIISSWLDLQTQLVKNDTQLLTDIKTVLAKLSSNAMYTDYVELMTNHLVKMGKEQLISDLVPTIKKSKKLLNYDGVLKKYQKDLSGKAPAITVIDHRVKIEGGNWEHRSTINFNQLKNKYTLVVFYLSDCGHCEKVLDYLTKQYTTLKAKGFEIYSLAADKESKVFEATASKLPWKHNYCDFKGFDGDAFKDYVIVGTPSLFLINKKGNIVQQMINATELDTWIKENVK